MSLPKKLKKIVHNEKGVTLVEVVASFVILVILLISFYTLFIQTAKTTKSSEDIVDATYIAQTEMEKIYNLISNNTNYSNAENMITKDPKNGGLGYIKECSGIDDETKTFYTIYKIDEKLNPNVTVTLKITANSYFPESLSNILIRVYETKEIGIIGYACGNKQVIKQAIKAQMESVIEWKAGS